MAVGLTPQERKGKTMGSKTKVILGAIAAILFAALIVLLKEIDVAAIGPEGTTVGFARINQAVHELTGEHMKLYDITQYLGYAAIVVAAWFALVGLLQLIQEKSFRRVDRSIWALAVLYIAVAALYVFFEKFIVNYRPIIMPGETEPAASFPSSHTMLFFVIFGSAAMMAGRHIQNGAARIAVQALCWVLVAFAVAARLVSGVHWCTDIVGGVLISTALLLFFSAALPDREDYQ